MSEKSLDSLAEKIARVLRDESGQTELSAIQSSIEKINNRLDGIEETFAKSHRIPELKTTHPSLEKFDVIEALADEIIGNLDSEKTCTFEPNGKPCDSCSMCSSRGF